MGHLHGGRLTFLLKLQLKRLVHVGALYHLVPLDLIALPVWCQLPLVLDLLWVLRLGGVPLGVPSWFQMEVP